MKLMSYEKPNAKPIDLPLVSNNGKREAALAFIEGVWGISNDSRMNSFGVINVKNLLECLQKADELTAEEQAQREVARQERACST